MCGKKGVCYMRNIHELIEDLRDYGSVKGNIGILSRLDEIQYKAENIGIKVIITEESYTSGTSFLDGELPIKKSYNKSRRITRGLFKTDNKLINADLNASYQIIKKVFPNAFADGIEGVGLHPVRINV